MIFVHFYIIIARENILSQILGGGARALPALPPSPTPMQPTVTIKLQEKS